MTLVLQTDRDPAEIREATNIVYKNLVSLTHWVCEFNHWCTERDALRDEVCGETYFALREFLTDLFRFRGGWSETKRLSKLLCDVISEVESWCKAVEDSFQLRDAAEKVARGMADGSVGFSIVVGDSVACTINELLDGWGRELNGNGDGFVYLDSDKSPDGKRGLNLRFGRLTVPLFRDVRFFKPIDDAPLKLVLLRLLQAILTLEVNGEGRFDEPAKRLAFTDAERLATIPAGGRGFDKKKLLNVLGLIRENPRIKLATLVAKVKSEMTESTLLNNYLPILRDHFGITNDDGRSGYYDPATINDDGSREVARPNAT